MSTTISRARVTGFAGSIRRLCAELARSAGICVQWAGEDDEGSAAYRWQRRVNEDDAR
jgi:hypothetical protein